MIEQRAYHGLQIAIAKNSSDKVCYILFPEGLKADGQEWMERAFGVFGCSIVTLLCMDW